MSEMRDILLEQVERLLAGHAGPELFRAVEAGEFPAALWAEVEALGLPLAMAPEAQGGVGLAWDDAVAVWVALGRHNAPIPLAETMAAAALVANPPAGVIALAQPDGATPWGRHAAHVLAGDGRLHPSPAWRQGQALPANEPLDRAALPTGEATLLAGALVNAAKLAGALETALNLSTEYANVRKQFGRPIGQFQAVSQQLAQAAGEVAAAGVAVANAGRAVARRGLAGAEFEIASAKLVAGEAAALVAAIAHQVHAAIGFTQEYHLHFTTRRLWTWRDAFGTERFWAERIGRAALARGGAALWPDLAAREDA
jgi:acyl-CoA dehydrogenase